MHELGRQMSVKVAIDWRRQMRNRQTRTRQMRDFTVVLNIEHIWPTKKLTFYAVN